MADVMSFFNETLKSKIEASADLASSINAIYVFDIDGAGTWTVDLKNGGGVSAGGHDDADCTVTAKVSDFANLLSNPSSAVMMFMQGKLKVSNPGLAMPLQKLLS